MADALVLACENGTPSVAGWPAAEAGVEVARVPSRPGREAVDPVLDRLGDRRLVVAGTDADLAAVALRLLRTERLATVLVGFVPVTPAERPSAAAATFALPAAPDRALRLALLGEVDPVPLIRDDAGGVLVGLGLLRRLRG